MPAPPHLTASSLRRRALLPTLGGALVLFATTIALLQAMMTQQLSERIRSRSATVARMVASVVESEQDSDELGRMVTALGAEPQIDMIVVTMGPFHQVLAATRSEWANRTLEDVGESRLATQAGSALASQNEIGVRLHDGDGMSYVVPIHREAAGGRLERGTVVVVVNCRALREQADHWLWRFAAVVLVLEVLTLAAAEFALRRYALRPIQAIAEAATRMRAGDRTARAPVYGDDELGRLAITLNEGHAGLNASIKELEFQKYALDQAANVMVTDVQGVIHYVNDAYCRLSGYSRGELVGQNPRIVNSGHHPAEFFRQMYETIAGAGVWRGELCNRARDGSLYWVRCTIIPSQDVAGRPVRYTAVLYDVSEHKQAEEALRESERWLRESQRTSRLGHYHYDIRKDIWHGSPELYAVLGTKEDRASDFAGWLGIVHPLDREKLSRYFTEDVIGRQTPFDMEYRIVRPRDGVERWVHGRGRVEFHDNGAPVAMFGTIQDITERAEADRDLRASEARTRQIIDTAIDAVITVDDAARITSWNVQAEKLFGWTAAEAIGSLLAETIVPPQYRAAHTRGFARFLRTGEGTVMGERLEITAMRRSGEEFPVELSISAMPLEQGMFFSAFLRDISERKRVETELVSAKNTAQSASRAKSEFLAMMSHEIRTPMNGVIGFTDLLVDSGLNDTQREYAETIRSSGQALLALINDILDFSKIEAGRLDMERVPFDARRAAAEVVELLSARAAESGIEVVFDWPASVPHQLIGDAMRFRQVLLNLAGNGLKFTTKGAVIVRAERDAHGGLCMQVRDTGIGIAEDKLGNLFRRFSQADSSTTRRFGGTGLGLAISKQLVELMGGTIGAESRLGQGSTFWFTLPLPAEQAATASDDDASGLAGVRVLVVHDQETVRRALCSQLAGRGIEALSAVNAEAALVLLRVAAAGGKPFRAAVIDRHLPVTNGEALGSAILADPATGSPALLLLASDATPGDAVRLRSQGFAEVMLLSIEHPELLVQALVRATREGTHGSVGSAAPAPAPPAPSTSVAQAAAEASGFITKVRVLLAEDHPVNQKLALRVLGKLGCAVDLSDNGIEACALAAATDYDIILMDCHMPEMDGFEATVAIRAREAASRAAGTSTRHTPIVALTASVLQEDRDHCIASGMDDFLSKPFRPDQLRSALERWARRDNASEGPLREAA